MKLPQLALRGLFLLGRFNNPKALPVVAAIGVTAIGIAWLSTYLLRRKGWNQHLASAIGVLLFIAVNVAGVVTAWFVVPDLVR